MKIYQIEENESRLFDTMKCILIVFVLFQHSYSGSFTSSGGTVANFLCYASEVISKAICDCSVPAFIFISSILYYSKPRKYLNNIQKKSKSLLAPYLIFNALWIICQCGKIYILHRTDATIPDYANFSLLQWLDSFLGLYGDFKPALPVLWYVRDLFLLNLFAPIIKKLVDCFPNIVLVSTLGIWISCIPSFIIHTYALVFFILGYYFIKCDLHLISIAKKIRLRIAIPIYIVLLGCDFLMHESGPLHRVFIILSIGLVTVLARRLNERYKKILLGGEVIFFIYLTHQFIYLAINSFVHYNVYRYLIMYVMKPLTALIICVLIYTMLEKRSPKLLGLLTGGRVARMRR